MTDKGLGYVHTVDLRDRRYPLSAAIEGETVDELEQAWPLGRWTGNQGSKPACVGFAFGGWLFSGPTRNRFDGQKEKRPAVKPVTIWQNAQILNPEQGSVRPTEGTNTTYAAEYLRGLGYISNYYNVEGAGGHRDAGGRAKTRQALEEIVTALLTKGPLVIGGPWYPSMFTPKKDGYLRVPDDEFALSSGGHAWLAYGIDTTTGDPEVDHLVMLNSWGEDWGGRAGMRDGTAKIPLVLLDRLFTYSAKAILAVESKV